MNTKRIRVRRDRTDAPVKRIQHYGSFLEVGDAVAIMACMGVWTVERFERDPEGNPLVAVIPVVGIAETRGFPRKVRLEDILPLRLEHIEGEIQRAEIALSALERIAQDLQWKEAMHDGCPSDSDNDTGQYSDNDAPEPRWGIK